MNDHIDRRLLLCLAETKQTQTYKQHHGFKDAHAWFFVEVKKMLAEMEFFSLKSTTKFSIQS